MDTLLLLELTDNLTEALAGLEKAKDDTLATLDAIDAVNDALIALGVKIIAPIVKDYTKLLQSVINGEVNIVEAKEKFAELEQAIKDLGGEDMPDDDTKQLVIDALQAAARQVIEANGYVVID